MNDKFLVIVLLFILVILLTSCSTNNVAMKSYIEEEPYLQTVTIEKQEVNKNDFETKLKYKRTFYFLHFGGF